jgi:hypothetical protein
MQLISMGSMCVSMAILSLIMLTRGTPDFTFAIFFVFVAYALGGVAIGMCLSLALSL